MAVHVATQDNSLADHFSRLTTSMHEFTRQHHFRPTVQPLGYPYNRCFHLPPQLKVCLVLFKSGNRHSLSGRRFLDWMDSQHLISAPSNSTNPMNNHKTSLVSIQCNLDCTMVAQTALVHPDQQDHPHLPSFPHLLTQDNGAIHHPGLMSLKLAAWRVLPL